jgi:hypothetical protein
MGIELEDSARFVTAKVILCPAVAGNVKYAFCPGSWVL